MIRCLSSISSQSLAIGIGITSPTETVDLRQTGWAMVPGNVGSLSGCDPPARRPAKGVGKGSGRVSSELEGFCCRAGSGAEQLAKCAWALLFSCRYDRNDVEWWRDAGTEVRGYS